MQRLTSKHFFNIVTPVLLNIQNDKSILKRDDPTRLIIASSRLRHISHRYQLRVHWLHPPSIFFFKRISRVNAMNGGGHVRLAVHVKTTKRSERERMPSPRVRITLNPVTRVKRATCKSDRN